MNKIQQLLDKSKFYFICAIIIISPIAGPCVLAALWFLNWIMPKTVDKATRLGIMTFFSILGGFFILFFGLSSLPLSLLALVIAMLLWCFHNPHTTSREKEKSREKGFSVDSMEIPKYTRYPKTEARSNGEFVDAEIIEDDYSYCKWRGNFNFK